MYVRMFYITILYALAGFPGICQSLDIEWEKRIGKPGDDVFNSIIEDVNGGFTVVGHTHPKDRGDMDFWLVRFSPEGNVITEKSFGTESNDLPAGVSRFSNGGYIIVGKSVYGDMKSQVLFVKTDPEGNEIWQKSLSNIGNASVKNVITMDDGTFIVSGAKILSENSEKIWVAKFGSEGELLWEKTFGDTGIAGAGSMKKLPDGGFVIAGRIAAGTIQDADLWMFRFDKEGNKLWDKQFESPNVNVWPECVCCSPDNNFVVVGWYGTCMNDINSEKPIFDYDLLLSKISQEGKLVWSKNIDSEGSEGGNAIVVRPDGKILMAGKKETSFLGRVGTWILLTDEEGSILAESVFPFYFGNDQATGIMNSSDGGFVVIGPGATGLEQQNSDGWIKKFKAF